MKKPDRTFVHFLDDIFLAMSRIEEYISGLDFPRFKKDYKTVDAVIRNFEVIGEAAKNIPPHIKQKHPIIPWEEMYRLRNKVSHEYFGIDYETIWEIAHTDLPANIADIKEIIALEKNES